MSAEVAIITNECVVLSADSAVTIGGKHYNSAHKLFQLEENTPVGVMNYGTESICGFSSTTLLKLFRKKLSTEQLPNLMNYPSMFLEFIKSDAQSFFPTDKQILTLHQEASVWTIDTMENIAEYICDADYQQYSQKKDFLSDTAKEDLVRKYIEFRLQELKDRKLYWIISTATRKWIMAQSKDSIRSCVKDFYNPEHLAFDSDLFHDKTLMKLLETLFVEEYLKTDRAGDVTGLVFAGYGKNDLYPSVVCLEIGGFVGDNLKFRFDLDKSFNVEARLKNVESTYVSEIIPFAQADEMVELYTRGIPLSFELEIDDIIGNVLLEQKIDQKKLTIIRQQIAERLIDFGQETYFDPIMGMLKNLPLEETAQLAELLIKLTAFRQRITANEESVGEPIDVAVITKGDGFIWHKRKSSLMQR